MMENDLYNVYKHDENTLNLDIFKEFCFESILWK